MRFSHLALAPFFCAALWPLAASSAFAQDDNGRHAAEKGLIEYLSRVRPLMGTFTITGESSKDAVERVSGPMEEALKERSIRLKRQPIETTRECRWVWGDTLEVMETLAGNAPRGTFYHSPSGYLYEAGDRNYNLTSPITPPQIRPLNFVAHGAGRDLDWYLDGGGMSTQQGRQLESPYFDAIDSRLAGDTDAFTISITKDDRKAVLLVSINPFMLHACEYHIKKQLHARVRTEEHLKGERGDYLPVRATLETYFADTEEPIRRFTLVASSVSQISSDDLPEVARLVLPSGSKVYDQELGQVSVLQASALAHDIVNNTGGINFVPVRNGYEALSAVETSRTQNPWWRFLPIVVTILIVSWLCLAVFRKHTAAAGQ